MKTERWAGVKNEMKMEERMKYLNMSCNIEKKEDLWTVEIMQRYFGKVRLYKKINFI